MRWWQGQRQAGGGKICATPCSDGLAFRNGRLAPHWKALPLGLTEDWDMFDEDELNVWEFIRPELFRSRNLAWGSIYIDLESGKVKFRPTLEI